MGYVCKLACIEQTKKVGRCAHANVKEAAVGDGVMVLLAASDTWHCRFLGARAAALLTRNSFRMYGNRILNINKLTALSAGLFDRTTKLNNL